VGVGEFCLIIYGRVIAKATAMTALFLIRFAT
jgi:hypothetical protein